MGTAIRSIATKQKGCGGIGICMSVATPGSNMDLFLCSFLCFYWRMGRRYKGRQLVLDMIHQSLQNGPKKAGGVPMPSVKVGPEDSLPLQGKSGQQFLPYSCILPETNHYQCHAQCQSRESATDGRWMDWVLQKTVSSNGSVGRDGMIGSGACHGCSCC